MRLYNRFFIFSANNYDEIVKSSELNKQKQGVNVNVNLFKLIGSQNNKIWVEISKWGLRSVSLTVRKERISMDTSPHIICLQKNPVPFSSTNEFSGWSPRVCFHSHTYIAVEDRALCRSLSLLPLFTASRISSAIRSAFHPLSQLHSWCVFVYHKKKIVCSFLYCRVNSGLCSVQIGLKTLTFFRELLLSDGNSLI